MSEMWSDSPEEEAETEMKECPYCYMEYNPVIENDCCPHELLAKLVKKCDVIFVEKRTKKFIDMVEDK